MTDFETEKSRLAKQKELIGARLSDSATSVEIRKKEIINYREYLWEQHGHDVMPPEQLEEMHRQENAYAAAANERERLEELCSSPYFARIDFREDGEKSDEQFYIGRYGFIDEDMEMPVYDWRSPVASMFYDYEYGKASYTCPAGVINGVLSLKRQFIIEDGELVSMFDSALEIQDEILKRMLSSGADGKMKNIVTTIQREQNMAIRDESADVLVVTGGAGSGKTSVALHRISYLLYRHKETLGEENVAVFSPSGTFLGYIGDVLPSLGESNIRRTTFQRFAGQLLGRKTESFFDYSELCLGGHMPEKRAKYAREKGSEKFARFIAERADGISASGPKFSDVVFLGRRILTSGGLKADFLAQSPRLSIEERMVRLRNTFYEKLAAIKTRRVEELKKHLTEEKGEEYFLSARELTAEARVAWTREFKAAESEYNKINMIDARKFYIDALTDFFGKEAADDFAASAELRYEDAAPLAAIKCLLGQIKPVENIRHAVVDEAQDYTYMQLFALSLILRHAKFTVLGDPGQRVEALSDPIALDKIGDIFSPRSVASRRLDRTYRSTLEITRYAASLIGADCSGSIDRRGEEPREMTAAAGTARLDKICELLGEFSRPGKNGEPCVTTAVITRTRADARRLYDALSGRFELSLADDADEAFSQGAVVIPACLAKGLEFDSVIVDAEFGEDERNLQYVCCTRALHRLAVIKKSARHKTARNMEDR